MVFLNEPVRCSTATGSEVLEASKSGDGREVFLDIFLYGMEDFFEIYIDSDIGLSPQGGSEDSNNGSLQGNWSPR